MPFPGNGFTVKSDFYVYSHAAYHLEAYVPIAIPKDEVDMPELPPIDCALRVRLSGPGFAPRETSITSLPWGGEIPSESLGLYESNETWLLKPGEYHMEVSVGKDSGTVMAHGALLYFCQFERPVESILFNALLYWSGVVLCFFGICGSLVCALIKHRPRT